MARNGFFPFTLCVIVFLARVVHMTPAISAVLVGLAWLTTIAHELGHVAVLRWTGGRVRGVIPTPFMGITLHDPAHTRRPVELALAGPLAGAAFGASVLVALHVLAPPHSLLLSAVHKLLWAGIADNLVFNLLPWGPLDGAYLVRALRDRRAARAFRRQADRQLSAAWDSARPAASARPPATSTAAMPATERWRNPRPIRITAAYSEARTPGAGARPSRSHARGTDLS